MVRWRTGRPPIHYAHGCGRSNVPWPVALNSENFVFFLNSTPRVQASMSACPAPMTSVSRSQGREGTGVAYLKLLLDPRISLTASRRKPRGPNRASDQTNAKCISSGEPATALRYPPCKMIHNHFVKGHHWLTICTTPK